MDGRERGQRPVRYKEERSSERTALSAQGKLTEHPWRRNSRHIACAAFRRLWSAVHSSDPTLVGKNHQVLAWGYLDDGPVTTVRVYDPNLPDDDTVTITFNHTDPTHTTAFHYSGDSEPIFGFFPATWYQPQDPAALLTQAAEQ